MPMITIASGLELCYETYGDPSETPLLSVAGLGSQLPGREPDFYRALAARGRYVICYDNRDVGLSTKFHGQPARIEELFAARVSGSLPPPVPYTLSDMAQDGMDLLTALGIDRAHIIGYSMGGMIAQLMAIEHAQRVLSLTSVMSHSGNTAYGRATPEAMAALSDPVSADRDIAIAETVERSRVYCSPRYFDAERAAFNYARDYDRMFYPEGQTRQFAAILAAPSRDEALAQLRVPTLVMHGREDTLIAPSGGEHTASLVTGANLLLLNDMGHDVPRPLWPVIVDAIISHQNHAATRP